VEKKPKSEKRRQTKLIPFRATEEEAAVLIAKARRENLSLSAYIRARVIEKPMGRPTAPRQRTTPTLEVLARLLGQLGKCGSNLNQVALRLNRGDAVVQLEIMQTLGELRHVSAEITKAMTEEE
jgi:hypothetical protein